MPLPLLHWAGGIAGRLVYAGSLSYRRTLDSNLRQAGLFRPELAHEAAAATGRSMLELPYVWLRPKRTLALTTTSDWHLIAQARARGRGIIFLTPHLGCFEVTAQHFAVNEIDGARITVLYRRPRKAALLPLVEGFRSRPNLELAAADVGGVRRLLRALKRGEAVGLLPDQVPSTGEGVWAPFFGRPAYTMTLPARLAEMTGATILLALGERLPHARGWCVRIYPFDEPLTGTPEERAALLNRAMEQLIRSKPEQYLWGYKRYKVPRGVTPPAP